MRRGFGTWPGAALVVLLWAGLPASAQKYPWNEAENHVVKAREVQSLGTDLFGDQVSLQDGALSFSATDVDIPGNSTLPVRFARSYRLFNREHQTTQEMLGDWEVSVPHLRGVFAPHWVGSTGTAAGRCSNAGAPPAPQPPSGVEQSVTAHAYWEGIDLEIPGVSSGELLVNLGVGAQPATGGPYPWVTSDHFRVSCLSSIQNGSGSPLQGQGFLAIGPDGTRYWFDWMAQYALPSSKQVSGPFDSVSGSVSSQGYEWYVTRRRNVLYATRVEDRFGNWVTYTYSNAPEEAGKLTEINASDGRRITVAYSGQTISSVTATSADASPRTWTYATATTAGSRRTLTSVTLPDATQWQLAFSQFTDAEIKYRLSYPAGEPVRSCTELEQPLNEGLTPVATVTHPSGAVGTFTASIQEHGRTNVPLGCANVQMPIGGNNPNDDSNLYPISFHQFSLTKKRISGLGVTAGEWNYAYAPSISVFMHPGTTWSNPFCTGAQCHQPPTCSGAPCEGSTQTIVTGPGGQWTRYTYGNSFKYNEGKLLRVEIGTGADNILYSEAHSYDFARSGRTYPLRLGGSTKTVGGYTDYYRPQTGVTKTQQGAAFTWQVADCRTPAEPCFDVSFVRPLQVTRFSTISGNPTRKEQTTYADNLTKWVVGQVSEVRCMVSSPTSTACNGGTGSLMSQTSYDATWALPLESKSFGKTLQTLAWDTASSVASGQRGTVKTVADGNGNVTTASNWKRGIPQSIKYPGTPEATAGATQSAVVNDHGWVTAMTDETGSKTCYEYDPMGRVNKITYPSDTQANVCDTSKWAATTITFSSGHAAAYGMPAGHWRQTTLTGRGRKVLVLDALWRPVVEQTLDLDNVSGTVSEVIQRYDTSGRLAFQSYPMRTNGAAVYTDSALKGAHTTYDALDRVTQVKQDWEGTGQLTTTTEYLSGFQTRVSNPRGHQTLTTLYHAFDQPTYDFPRGINHPEGAFTEIHRDIFGKITALKRRNASGSVAATRSYAYNTNQELCRAVDPETGATLMGYDGAGNLTWSASGLASGTACHATGNTTAINARKAVRTYDGRNRLGTLSFPDGRGDQTWTYTPDGLPASIATTVTGSDRIITNSYSYNRRRLLTREQQALTGWGTYYVNYAYNGNGHLSTVSYPAGFNGAVVDYAPNALGQPTQAGTFATSVSHHPNGAIKQFTYGNGIVHTLTQNARGLPAVSKDAYGGTSILQDEYAYDQNGNVLAITDAATGQGQRGNRTMTYDPLDRLTQAASPMFGTATYGYDVLDNLTRVKVTGGNNVRDHYYCYDATWRLTNVKTGSCSGTTVMGLGYDAQGNLSNKSGQVYSFDYGNRLREVTGKEDSFHYDGHGRRVLSVRRVNGSNWLRSAYSLDGRLVFQQDQGIATRKDFIYLGNTLIAERSRPSTSEGTPVTVKYQHTDALGSPAAVTNESRTVVERTEYEPYGHPANRGARSGVGYTGHVEDAATGLLYAQQRYYDPAIGRFLSVDPVQANPNTGASFNRYVYASNNPYKFIDPDGRSDLNLFKPNDPLYAAGETFNIPGMFDMTGHADPGRIIGPKGDMTPGQTIELARGAGLKEGHTLFVGACNVGAEGGAYAQSLANKNNSLVIAATGFAMFPTTQPKNGGTPYVPGNPVTLTVNMQRDGKGAAGTFAVFAPGGSGPIASGIRSVTYNPETGKAQFRMAPETGSRISRTVSVCADKEKCGK